MRLALCPLVCYDHLDDEYPMKKEPIEILHTTISPCDNERRIFNEAFSALAAGFRTEILALKTPQVQEESLVDGLRIHRIKTRFWKGGPLKFLVFNWKLFWKLLRTKITLIHAHDLWVLPGSALVALLKKSRLIYDAHEFTPGLEIFRTRQASASIWALAERLLIGKADFLITINNYHTALFRERYGAIPQSEVIFNFSSIRNTPNSKSIPTFEQREYSVVFQGIFKPGRALPTILESISLISCVHLDLIGFGEMERQLKNMTERYHLNDRISFKGKIDWMDIIQETQKARAGLVLFEPTSINYTYAAPNKFFEYVMSGTPLIASDIPTFKEFNKTFEVALLVKADSPRDIARAIQIVLTDEERWNHYHSNCLKARKQWNWEKQQDKLIGIYRRLLPVASEK
jgi:glycosyltransferase involved in cell wall biosynthesis